MASSCLDEIYKKGISMLPLVCRWAHVIATCRKYSHMSSCSRAHVEAVIDISVFTALDSVRGSYHSALGAWAFELICAVDAQSGWHACSGI